ncbi:MAG: hypothetical protein KDA78_00450 [Planctomycetaceae bacterium]|nr:hypothetical protein [Planctomycetaceae bacterium]
MSDQIHRCTRQMFPAVLFCLAMVIGAVHCSMQPVLAQPAETEEAKEKAGPIRGKLISLEQKGRNYVLKMTTEAGEEVEHLLTSRTPVEITADGDASMIQNDLYVKAIVNRPNEMVVMGSSFDLYPTMKGRKPAGKIVKAPPRPGQSVNDFIVTGVIAGREPDGEYPDYEAITIQVSGKSTARVLIKGGVKTTLQLNDPKFAEPDSTVILHGTPLPRDRFNITGVEIKVNKKFTLEELMSAE